MNIQFEWPPSRHPVALPGNLTVNNAAVLDVASGGFGPHVSGNEQDAVAFYWDMTRPVMLNLCANHVCRLDDLELQYGSVHPLREKSKIQVGHFKLVMTTGSDEVDEAGFYELIYPNGAWLAANKIPDVEEILPNGGNYINDLRYFNDVVLAQDKGNDVLKTLEVEYKRFLIWRELDGGHYDGVSGHSENIIKTDHRFDSIREKIKEKTLTECIVAKDFLMEKVWPELEVGDHSNDIFNEEDKVELLKALSPEHIVAKGKYKVPELVFQDFYKVGLDSHY
ncbi:MULTISPECIES: TagK domain-containing protein [unclassified Serratia (in: enterobacteria)]|uniref:TagK domain-containing protein n=1 Tax=unclassified Serratia (in: enterobacteria) TaxID=2647522 RepID=UPI002ED0A36A|nr:TagK domain-containing protein [Serratia sp. C2(2)]MEE4448016.1 TagK domain-containing protein [Serratia sp. C2(1)]